MELDPQAILADERRSMGRGCELVGAEAVVAGDTEVMMVVYDCAPVETHRGQVMLERRVALAAIDHAAENAQQRERARTSLIVSTRFLTDESEA